MKAKRILIAVPAALMAFGLLGCGVTGTQNGALSAEQQQILADRRQAVMDEMRHMNTFLWRTDKDITYSKKSDSNGIENDPANTVLTLQAGRLYSGLPYTHGCGSAFDFQAFSTGQDEKGIYQISGMTWEALTGVDGYKTNTRARVGNDCSESVYWAWSKIAASVDFKATNEMTEAHGCIRVGEYNCDSELLKNTKDVCAENGTKTMFAAYAQLQPGDAVVHNNLPDGGSHAMLVTSVVIKETEDGQPDYMNSYVTVVHQTSGNLFSEKFYYDEKLGENVYYCGGIDDEYPFHKLFSTGYLPVTCKELIDPAPLTVGTVTDSVEVPAFANITEGTFASEYAISNVTITISDNQGKTVQQVTCFATEDELKCIDLVHFTDPEEVKVGSLDLTALAPGSYHCTHTCQLSTGEKLTVRDFDFTV